MKHFGSFFQFKSKEAFYLDGFNAGFLKAWEMALPIMSNGVEKLKSEIRTRAIDESLANLEVVIDERIKKSGNTYLRHVNALISKQKEFQQKLTEAKTQEQKQKYENFVEALSWALDGDLS